MAAPRIGRADRLAALRAQLEAEGALGLPPGWPAVTRLAMSPSPALPAGAARRAGLAHAGQLAELLDPLPGALAEMATRIRRHCANTGRDAELAHAVDLVHGKVFDLFCATVRLADAAKSARHGQIGRST